MDSADRVHIVRNDGTTAEMSAREALVSIREVWRWSERSLGDLTKAGRKSSDRDLDVLAFLLVNMGYEQLAYWRQNLYDRFGIDAAGVESPQLERLPTTAAGYRDLWATFTTVHLWRAAMLAADHATRRAIETGANRSATIVEAIADTLRDTLVKHAGVSITEAPTDFAPL